MATYYVKTYTITAFGHPNLSGSSVDASSQLSRTIVIEADSYRYDDGNFNFYKNNPVAKKAGILVASVPSRDVLAVLEENAYQEDYFFNPDTEEGEDETGDIFNDCLLEQLVKSDVFFDGVYSILDFYFSPDNEDEPATESPCEQPIIPGITPLSETSAAVPDVPAEKYPVPETPTAVPDTTAQQYPIEKWQTQDGGIQYGFHTTKGFVNAQDDLKFAKTCRDIHKEDPDVDWSYLDLTGATKLEENL